MIKIKLKKYIEEKNVPIMWLSEKTGIRYATLWDLINNEEKKRINLVYLSKVMEALNVSDINKIIKWEKTG